MTMAMVEYRYAKFRRMEYFSREKDSPAVFPGLRSKASTRYCAHLNSIE